MYSIIIIDIISYKECRRFSMRIFVSPLTIIRKALCVFVEGSIRFFVRVFGQLFQVDSPLIPRAFFVSDPHVAFGNELTEPTRNRFFVDPVKRSKILVGGPAVTGLIAEGQHFAVE